MKISSFHVNYFCLLVIYLNMFWNPFIYVNNEVIGVIKDSDVDETEVTVTDF